MEKTVVLTEHAFNRCAQRNVSIDDVCYGIQHGRSRYNAGVKAYFLGARNIPDCDRRNQRRQQLVGLVILVDEKDDEIVVLTAYRNRERGWKDHRSKSKYCKNRTPAA